MDFGPCRQFNSPPLLLHSLCSFIPTRGDIQGMVLENRMRFLENIGLGGFEDFSNWQSHLEVLDSFIVWHENKSLRILV